MKGLSDEELIEVYQRAVKYQLEQDFIDLIKAEIFHRNLSLPEAQPASPAVKGVHHLKNQEI